jgi:large subunit ribosomal protein L25
MAKQVQLKARPRTATGKTRVKQLRAQGVIPAVIYGANAAPLNVGVAAKEFADLLHRAASENVLVDLQLEQDDGVVNRLALIQEVQHHPVEDRILHVDFREVSATEKFRTSVPVRALGEPEGVKTSGGILETVMHDLRVECLPADLPDRIEVNVESLQIGQSIHIGDIQPPPGVTLVDDKDQPVFIVVAPIAEEEVAPTTEITQPERIGEKPEQAEGEETTEAGAKPKVEPPKGEAGKPEPKPATGKAAAKPEPRK